VTWVYNNSRPNANYFPGDRSSYSGVPNLQKFLNSSPAFVKRKAYTEIKPGDIYIGVGGGTSQMHAGIFFGPNPINTTDKVALIQGDASQSVAKDNDQYGNIEDLFSKVNSFVNPAGVSGGIWGLK
jgi:hypothetical protein